MKINRIILPVLKDIRNTDISNENDTLESIIIRFYGSYSMKREQAIKAANGMKNPNALSIGQKLRIPLN